MTGRESLVYFLKCGPYLRIGWLSSGDADAALRATQRFCPYPVLLLGTREGDEVTALELRSMYREHLHRDAWFRLEGDLLELPELVARPELRVAADPAYENWSWTVVDDQDMADEYDEGRALVIAGRLRDAEEWCRTFDVVQVYSRPPVVRVLLGERCLGYLREVDGPSDDDDEDEVQV